MRDLEEFLRSGEYLPVGMRDFHDQKDIFKTMHSTMEIKDVNWVQGSIYVIDSFLWWMARRGYTLQRSKVKCNFRDLAKDVEENREQRIRSLGGILTATSTGPEGRIRPEGPHSAALGGLGEGE